MVQSKQEVVDAVATASFTAKEGRLRAGIRFRATVARVEELRARGLADFVKTQAIDPASFQTKSVPTPTPTPAPAPVDVPQEPIDDGEGEKEAPSVNDGEGEKEAPSAEGSNEAASTDAPASGARSSKPSKKKGK